MDELTSILEQIKSTTKSSFIATSVLIPMQSARKLAWLRF